VTRAGATLFLLLGVLVGCGGRSAHGESGARGAVPSDPAAVDQRCGPLIDDMEDGTGRICRGEGRVGVWYVFHDDFCPQWPEETEPGTPIEVSALPEPRGASKRAMHTFYEADCGAPMPESPLNDGVNDRWGAGIGLDLAYDGSTYLTYDASAYSGITFWARGSAAGDVGSNPARPLEFRVGDASSTSVLYGGTNEKLAVGRRTSIYLTPEWHQYWVPFASLAAKAAVQEPYAPFQPAELTNIQFFAEFYKDVLRFDFWIDDIAFYSGQANCCSPGCPDPPAFAMPNIESSVAYATVAGPGPASCEALCFATNVGVSTNAQPTDLRGIDCLGELAVASFYQSGITDLAPLAANQRLASLDLSANPLADLTPLAGLPALSWLSLSNDRVMDAAPLARLPALTYLNAGGNSFGALELDDAQRLRVILANSNQIARFRANTERLEELVLGSNRLTELTLDAPVLKTLDVSLNGLTRLSLTAPSLSSATLANNELTTLAGLEGCPHLEHLDARSNPLLDLSALEHASELWQLELASTGISSSALVHLTQLHLGYLGLSGNPIDDISALANAEFAKVPARPNAYLDLSQTKVKDLSPLVQNPNIDFWSVGLAGCPLDCAAQAENLAALAARGITLIGACQP